MTGGTHSVFEHDIEVEVFEMAIRTWYQLILVASCSELETDNQESVAIAGSAPLPLTSQHTSLAYE